LDGGSHAGQGIVLTDQLPPPTLLVDAFADETVDQHKIPDCPADWVNRSLPDLGNTRFVAKQRDMRLNGSREKGL